MKAWRTRAFATAVLLAAIVACSTEDKPSGALMLAFQTDMSLPKDVDQIRVQVLQRGTVLYDETFDLGPRPDLHPLPATLAVTPPKDKSTPVTVKVIALRKNAARTLRQLVTIVPTTRLALARMPIQWLCDEKVAPGAGNAYESTCPPGQSCLDGECTANEIDSATFPDYVAADVFGGGDEQGNGGTCFDTLKCFADAKSFPLDLASCSISFGASDGDPTAATIAVQLPAGDTGICDLNRCLIPLDAGLLRIAGATVTLPRVLCDRMQKEPTRYAVVVSSRCGAKSERMPPCGPWSSVGPASPGAQPDAGISPPVNNNNVDIVFPNHFSLAPCGDASASSAYTLQNVFNADSNGNFSGLMWNDGKGTDVLRVSGYIHPDAFHADVSCIGNFTPGKIDAVLSDGGDYYAGTFEFPISVVDPNNVVLVYRRTYCTDFVTVRGRVHQGATPLANHTVKTDLDGSSVQTNAAGDFVLVTQTKRPYAVPFTVDVSNPNPVCKATVSFDCGYVDLDVGTSCLP